MRARRLGIEDRDLLFAGFVRDRELAAMYRRCALFLFPSLYEGFGLPILEAMSCGAPVAAASNSSIPEVLGDLSGTFDASDPNDIAATLGRILQDPEELQLLRERSRRRVAHFTWERTAEKVIEGYERALEVPAGRVRSRRTRKRVAIVTPWPPQSSPQRRAASDWSRLSPSTWTSTCSPRRRGRLRPLAETGRARLGHRRARLAARAARPRRLRLRARRRPGQRPDPGRADRAAGDRPAPRRRAAPLYESRARAIRWVDRGKLARPCWTARPSRCGRCRSTPRPC